VIKAVMHLHEDYKTMWDTYTQTYPDKEYDWNAFNTWLDATIRDQGNDELAVKSEWLQARQKQNQAP
jgi:hypothetical protein